MLPADRAPVLDDTALVSVLAIAVPVIVVLAVGYVKRGRQVDRQGVKIDHLVDLAEEGKREHAEMGQRLNELEKKVAFLEGRARNGQK